MGQKVKPIAARIGITTTWRNSWICRKRDYAKNVETYYKVINVIKKNLNSNLYSNIDIVNTVTCTIVNINTHRSSVVATKIEELKKEATRVLGIPIDIKIRNIASPETDPQLIAKKISEVMKKRKDPRQIMKNITNDIKTLKGIQIILKGRINGVEIAQQQQKMKGIIKRQNLRADIEEVIEHVQTKSGLCSVRVIVQK